MINYPHLATRLFNVPLAIKSDKAEIVMAALADRFGIAKLFNAQGVEVSLSDLEMQDRAKSKAYQIIEGVAVIPVTGTLVHKLGTMQPYSGMTGYDGIRACLSLAMNDDAVKAIMLDIDSPGGEVAGCFDLVDDIYNARGTKPMWSILSESAYSAAYAIASATDKITVPRTGGVGSVGVIALHTDISKALDQAGIVVTMFKYGERKGEGNEFQPLSDSAKKYFQADIDEAGELFINTVARNRNMKSSAVRATEAGTFQGSAGVEIGFADEVLSPNKAFVALLSEIGVAVN
jgi:capsid assembly protease